MHCSNIENRGLDAETFAFLCDVFGGQPCHRSLGFEIIYLGQGIAGMRMVTDLKYSTGQARVHGGIIASLADTVMSLAASTCGHIYRTAEMKINYLKPVFALTELRAEAKVVHPGKTIAVVEADFYDVEGKLAAKSMGTFFRDIKARTVKKGDGTEKP
ncbi:MAG: PaaI family thioesterase [Syntrophomonadaceae bacterium]